MPNRPSDTAEWLETDGLGGFASGTVGLIRTRRYHALLLVATTPPTGRFVLVNGFDAWVETPAGSFPISSQSYMPGGLVHPDGVRRIQGFTTEPWPRWTFRVGDGTEIVQEIFARHGAPVVALSWRLAAPRAGVSLIVRPFMSGRDYHALQRENLAFRFAAVRDGNRLVWHPYDGVPGIVVLSNGEYIQQPDWYRRFLYQEERARGLDCAEDLASPGVFHWDLSRGEAVWILTSDAPGGSALASGITAEQCVQELRAAERARRQQPTRLDRAADAYLVRRREAGETIVAGYPWFTDWGRDTFIALRGLCLATGRLEHARKILLQWAATVSEGMLPNRFPDYGEAPEFNSVDASLWYIIAVDDLLRTSERVGQTGANGEREALLGAVETILTGYAHGTRYGIRADDDGLLAAGRPGIQLTWMDAKIGDRVVTPRIGKPVEIQALWLNALHIGSARSERWAAMLERGRVSFGARFWNAAARCLHDVVDPDHRRGAADSTFRPNQILAVGGLPLMLLEGKKARAVVDAVEGRLLTPLGLRSLAPGERGYVGRYEGDGRARDGAYHQGTVWPWLIGPFVEAWVRVRGNTLAAKTAARERFVTPLLSHLDSAGIGHVSEIADGDPPHTPRGCPFQAWSVGELIRLDRVVLAE